MDMTPDERIAILERQILELTAQRDEARIGMLQATIAAAEIQLPMLHAQLRAVQAKIAEAEKK